MPYSDWFYIDAEKRKWREIFYRFEFQMSNSGIGLLRKTIKKALMYNIQNVRFGIYGNRIIATEIS